MSPGFTIPNQRVTHNPELILDLTKSIAYHRGSTSAPVASGHMRGGVPNRHMPIWRDDQCASCPAHATFNRPKDYTRGHVRTAPIRQGSHDTFGRGYPNDALPQPVIETAPARLSA